ncbi:MAG: hypothetical protein IPI97_04530 [Nitrosomonas sp.]|jgi:hypothetical protein|nr:hypothetical protein [Nitrosomonas sp.]
MAKTHGGDAKEMLKHAEMSLKYSQDTMVKGIEKINVPEMKHMDASVKHLISASSIPRSLG